ncbi:MAG TPA: hypothetical protein VMZ91_14660 [Candidatus Paceibacterota bacterium]|nr:hypothetical protein [Candidatus Paceibacterota bacterium]
MKKCEDCETEIDDKYIVCVSCLKKRNAGNSKAKDGDFVRAIQQNNNNLYAIRTILEKFLEEKGHLLVWNKKDKCFDIVKVEK